MTEEELKEHQKFVEDITKAIEEFKFDPIKVHGQGKKLENLSFRKKLKKSFWKAVWCIISGHEFNYWKIQNNNPRCSKCGYRYKELYLLP